MLGNRFMGWGWFRVVRIRLDWFSKVPRLRMAGRENGELVAIGSNVSYAGHLLTNSPV
jgi:hypothetical protein